MGKMVEVGTTNKTHINDFEKAINEIERVIKNDGSIYMIDTITSDQKILNDWHQKIETIRDKSHIKNYSLMEWKNYFEGSKLYLKEIHQTRVNMELEDWMERSGTNESDKNILRNEYDNANNKIKKFYNSVMVRSDLTIAGSNFIFNHESRIHTITSLFNCIFNIILYWNLGIIK